MLSVAVTSALLGIAAIVIRKLFGSRTGIKPFIIMWAVVFIKFAVPVELPSHLSVMNLFAKSASTVESAAETPSQNDYFFEENAEIVPAETESEVHSEQSDISVNYTEPTAAQEPSIAPDEVKSGADIADIAYSVYFSVTALLLFCILFAAIVCTVRFHRLPKLENELCGKILRESGIKRRVSIRCGEIDTPAVFGVLFPVIILPEAIDKNDEKLMRHIILHECCHIRHFDPLWNILTLAVCAVNWFDPVVWVCRYMYLADAEKLCDMSVLGIIGNENRREYANSLLRCAAAKKHSVMLVSGFGESGIKSRIKNIMSMKKVRAVAVIAVLAAILVSAVIFGTGKNISLTAKYDESKVSDTGDVRYFAQTLEDDGDEVGKLIVRVYDRSVHYVDISFESEDYTLDSIKSTTEMQKVGYYRIYGNGGDKGEYFLVRDGKGYADVSYEKELDTKDPDYSIEASFDAYNGNANIKITLDYKLKKGIFNAGTYSFTCEFDPLDPSEYKTLPNEFALMENSAGYTSEYNDETGEFELRSDKTDVMLTVSDSYQGFYAVKNMNGSEVRKHFGGGISPIDGTSDVSDIILCDADSDGTDDIAVVTYYRETVITVINGADLSEISVDETAVKDFLDIKIEQLSDTEFNVSCAGKKHVFTVDEAIGEKLSIAENGCANYGENVRYYVRDGRLYADSSLYLSADNWDLYRYITDYSVAFGYSDGKLVPVSAEMNTDNDAYYIKDEPAAKAEEVFWKYEIGGYNIPYRIELVSAEGRYCLRSVNSRTGTYYGSCELPTEKLPEDIDEYFKFTGLKNNDPGLIIYTVPNNNSKFADEQYSATFYRIDLNGKLRRIDIIDENGKKTRSISISNNFTAENGYMKDCFNGDDGKINMRLDILEDMVHVIDMTKNSDEYRAIESIDLKAAVSETDTAQTVYYNADGEAQKSFPIVNGRIYNVSDIFNSISNGLMSCGYIGTECETGGSAYSVTKINVRGESYVFTIYDSGILQFSYNDITEFYELDDADVFRDTFIWATEEYYMNIIMNEFVAQFEGFDHSTGTLEALVDENCGLGAVSEWGIFKELTVVSDIKYVKISGDETSCIFKFSFNVNSFDPAPFRNGDNIYEVVISENENGETKITSIKEVQMNRN